MINNGWGHQTDARVMVLEVIPSEQGLAEPTGVFDGASGPEIPGGRFGRASSQAGAENLKGASGVVLLLSDLNPCMLANTTR